MRINVGSTNPVKIESVREAFGLFYDNLIIRGGNVESKVENQPKNLDTIVTGALNRAKACFNNCDYSVGIESGIFPVSQAPTGYINTSCSIIYDGNKIAGIGLSSGFEYPKFVIDEIFEKKKEVGKIFDEKFETLNINKKGGAISILSKGKLHREKFHTIGTIMALLPIINKELYRK